MSRRLIFGYLRELKPAMRAIYSEIVTAEFFRSSTYFTEVQWLLSKKTIFFRGSRGMGGGVGSNCLFPIETHITCDFPGGPDPLSLYLEVHIFFWISIFILLMISRICAGSPKAFFLSLYWHDQILIITPRECNFGILKKKKNLLAVFLTKWGVP